MKKLVLICLSFAFCMMLTFCGKEKQMEVLITKESSYTTEEPGDDYYEYPNVNTSSDSFKECFKKVEGDWYDGDHKLSFYIEDDMYKMSGWTDKARIIVVFDPVRNNENQFEIGLDAGEMEEFLLCEIISEDTEIMIKDTKYIRKLK